MIMGDGLCVGQRLLLDRQWVTDAKYGEEQAGCLV